MIYLGRESLLAWVLNRIAGVAVAVFVLIHIIDTSLVALGPAVYNEAIHIYRQPVVRVLEVLLAGGVMYHAGNGLRVMLIDFFPGAIKYNRSMIAVGLVVFPVAFVILAYVMLRPVFLR